MTYMAGAGLPSGGIQLPSGGAATFSRYACDQAGTCYVPTTCIHWKFHVRNHTGAE